MISGVITCTVTAVLTITAYVYCLRYNLHMFQLNGYKNREHMTWLRKYMKRQWVLYAGSAFALLWIIARRYLAVDILMWLWLLLIIVVFRALNGMSVKKKLVYTARVKRLYICVVILDIAMISLGMSIMQRYHGAIDINALKGLMLLAVSLKFISPVIGCIVNSPMEKCINLRFINDAKRRLKEADNMTVIGVTGSYGKTSVKYYLGELLSVRYNVLITPESYNTPMGVVKTIREHLKPGTDIFVCEMGARHVGDIKEICDIVHPRHGVITSIGPQHLETFFNMENIKNTKFELADALSAGGMLFLNGDNVYIQEKAGEYGNKTFYYAESAAGDSGHSTAEGYFASDITVSQTGTEFTVTAPDGESERFHMRLIGAHNVINVVGAISVANKLGIALKDLRIPVRRIEPVPHRMQMREHGLVTIIDDAYNSNPVGSKAAVETLAMFDGVRILVTPGMVELGDKEREYNYKFGTYAADCCDYILLVGRKHTEPIREGVLSKGFAKDRCLVYDKLEEALSYAYSIKEQGHKYILLENDLPDNY